jgi:hypothetical protein
MINAKRTPTATSWRFSGWGEVERERSVVVRARGERFVAQPGVALFMLAVESFNAEVMLESCSPIDVMAAVFSRREEEAERGARVASANLSLAVFVNIWVGLLEEKRGSSTEEGWILTDCAGVGLDGGKELSQDRDSICTAVEGRSRGCDGEAAEKEGGEV